MSARRLSLPQEEGPPVPWDYFLLAAARGAPAAPEALWLGVRAVVGLRLGRRAESVDEAEIDRALARLPAEARPWLTGVLARLELPLPAADAAPPREPRFTSREAVAQDLLLGEAAAQFLGRYGSEGFYAAFEAVDAEPWCARAAVELALYLLLLQEL